MSKQDITAQDVVVALEREFGDGWKTFTEVSSPHHAKTKAWPFDFEEDEHTEYKTWKGAQETQRSIDFLAISHYANREATSVACEIKVNRSDFLAELRSEKYKAWLPYSDYLYFVTTEGVVAEGEIPEGCGHILVTRHGKGFSRKFLKRPLRRRINRPPWRLVANLVNRLNSEASHYRYDFYERKHAAKRLARALRRVLDGQTVVDESAPSWHMMDLEQALSIVEAWK